MKKKKASTSGGVAKKTRRNGIKDGYVCRLCVYAVVPCFFIKQGAVAAD